MILSIFLSYLHVYLLFRKKSFYQKIQHLILYKSAYFYKQKDISYFSHKSQKKILVYTQLSELSFFEKLYYNTYYVVISTLFSSISLYYSSLLNSFKWKWLI